MTNLVSPDEIENIVGLKRSETLHYGRAVSREHEFYILHSSYCLHGVYGYNDLRDCPFSKALDLGTESVEEDVPLILYVDPFNFKLNGVRSERRQS